MYPRDLLALFVLCVTSDILGVTDNYLTLTLTYTIDQQMYTLLRSSVFIPRFTDPHLYQANMFLPSLKHECFCDLDIVLGPVAISMIFQLIVQLPLEEF